ncbi:hypothetical protein AGMMS50239_40230 [Bacteroidia bacterium]|nr:hypothetical protein AGMMS50239_40230 [Bacteroidia bacterium]
MELNLHYQIPDRTVLYEFRRTEESELRGGKSENAVRQYFSLTYTGKKEGLTCFDYQVSRVLQTNHEGLYAWIEDMYPLMQYLQLGISWEGRIEKVFNLPDIYNRWVKKIWYETKQKHKGEDKRDAMLENIDALLQDEAAFANSLCYAPPFSLFFSGLHGMKFEKEKEEKRKGRLLGFGGAPFLPLILEDEIKVSESPVESYEVKTTGKIDEKEFDRKLFSNFVRTMSNDPMAIDSLLTRHSERYLFDKHHWVKTGMWLHLSTVPYFMIREERCFLKALES